MTPEQFEDVVANLMRVKRTGKTYYFFMCAKGSDDAPIFLLERKASTLRKAAREARRTAKVKIFARGSAQMNAEKKALFVVEEGALQPERMRKLLVTKLAKETELARVAPLLRKAEVIDLGTYEERVASGAIVKAEPESTSSSGEDGSFEGLYERAEEIMTMVSAALAGEADYAGRVREMLVVLHRSADVHEGGKTDEALKMVQRVLDAGPKMLKTAWKVESAVVQVKFGEAKTALTEAHGSTSDAYAAAFEPLDKQRVVAFNHRKADRWQEALRGLNELDRMLDALDPTADSEEDEAAVNAFNAELDLVELPEDDEALEAYSDVSDEALTRMVKVSTINSALRGGVASARAAVKDFGRAMLADEDLVERLSLDESTLDTLLGELPDIEAVVKLGQGVLKTYGSEQSFHTYADAVRTQFDGAIDNPKLAAMEHTHLGTFSIIAPLDTARTSALSALN